MQNKILTKGKGEIAKISVDSIYGFEAFADKNNKKLYINLLKESMSEEVCLIAYCVLDRSAHFVVKGNDKSAIKTYTEFVNSTYASSYKSGKVKIGYPLRSDYSYEKIKSEELKDVIIFIHNLAPDANARNYRYCSYNYLLEGSAGGTRIIISEADGNMTRAEYITWLESSSGKSYISGKDGQESFKKVIAESTKNYLNSLPQSKESTLLFVIADTCIRTGAPYKKVICKLNISYKKRRDILIGTACELVENRGLSFDNAYSLLKLNKESYQKLLIETMVEINRIYGYSYDYIAAKMGLADYSYDILVNILCGLNKRFNYSFEEMCIKFHLQNDILEIRSRCGF